MEAFLAEANWPMSVELGKVLQRCNHKAASAPISAFVRVSSTAGGVTCKVIHAAKGETYEAVMVVCGPARRGRECDMAQWLHPTDADAQRTGYVAMTRPRKVLVLAVPEDTPVNLLEELRGPFDV